MLLCRLGVPQQALHIFSYNIILQIHHIAGFLF